MIWQTIRKHKQVYIALPELVVVDRREASEVHVTAPASSGGVNLLPTTRAGSGSLCFKYHKAQTQRHPAPVVMDALSGLNPANTSRLQLHEGHTDEKCYREEDTTLSTYRKEWDKHTYWKKYVPRTSIDKLCEGTKKNGQPCQKLAEPGGRFCSYHKNQA